MRAVLLVGHSSPGSGAGAAMIRLAARVRALGIAPIVGTGFLYHSRPTFGEGLAHCLAKGATELVIQPYFLTPDEVVCEELPQQLETHCSQQALASVQLAAPFGDHPALAALVLKRAAEAEYLAAHPHLLQPRRDRLFATSLLCDAVPSDVPEPCSQPGGWLVGRAGLVIMAHNGDALANRLIFAVAERVRATQRYALVLISFLERNKPAIASTIDQLAASGVSRIVAVPYFLDLDTDVLEDMLAMISIARARHPELSLVLAEHLGYDRLLVSLIAERVAQAVAR